MKPKFNRMYAFREIKSNPVMFLSIFATALVSLIFIFNMLIYMESKRISDIHYYNVGFEIILHEMQTQDIAAVQDLPYVNSVRAIKFKGTPVEKTTSQLYTLHVHLNPEDAADVYQIYKRCDQIIADCGFWNKPYYESWKGTRDTFGIHSIDEFYNIELTKAMRNTYVFTGWTGIGIILAGFMMAAEMITIFGMKIKSKIREYASLRSCGLKITSFVSINAYQVVWMVSAAFVPAFFISMLAMKQVCKWSNNLYPQIRDNTPLVYQFPPLILIAAFLLILLASWAGIRFLCMKYEKMNVSVMIKGDPMKLSHVEKSSEKAETETGLSLYGKIISSRMLKIKIKNVILTLLLVMFPMILSYGTFMYSILGQESEDIPAYTIYSGKNGDSVPMTVINKIKGIDGVESVDISDTPGIFYANQAAITDGIQSQLPDGNIKTLYMLASDELKFDFIRKSDEAFSDFSFDLLNEPYSVAVHKFEGESGSVKAGDIIKIDVDGTPLTLKVAYVIESDKFKLASEYQILSQKSSSMNGYTYKTSGNRIEFVVLCSPYTMARVFGVHEVCPYVEIHAETGREAEVISRIEKIIGAQYSFRNEFEMSLYQDSWFGINTYMKAMKSDAVSTYVQIFLYVHIIFLYICSAVIICLVTSFETRNRKKEFAVLRAFGAERKEVVRLATKGEFKDSLFTAVHVILLPFVLTIAAIVLTIFGRTWTATVTALWGLVSSMALLTPVFIIFVVFLVTLRVVSARISSSSVTTNTVFRDLSE